MDSFNQKVERINTAKEAIKTSLTNKGMTPSNNIEEYAALIDSIEQGSGDVKLFSTIEEMNNSNNPIENDLAIIYRQEMVNWDGASALTTLTFPKTVKLKETGDGNCYGHASSDTWLDLEGSVSTSSATFRIMGDDYYTIRYTSIDGITYTRTDSYDETLVLSQEPLTLNMYEWSDVCGYFMTVRSAKFEGLYNYIEKADPEYTEFIRNADYDSEDEPYYETTNIYTKDLIKYINETVIPSVDFDIGNVVIVKNNDSQYSVYTDNSQYVSSENCVNAAVRSTYRTNGKYYIARYNNNSDNIKTMHKFIINTTEWTFTHETQELGQYANGDDISGLWFTTINIKENISEGTKIYAMVSYSTDKNWSISYYPAVSQILRWHIADTQFTATNANQLLPGVKVLGKNGPLEGDKTIYDNLEPENYIGKLLNTEMIPEQINGTVQYFPDYVKSKDVVTLPEENIQVHYIKKKLLENEDLVLTSLDKNFGVKTTDDGKFSIKKADGDDSNLYNIINNETGEVTTYSVPFTNSLYIVDHKVYGFSINSAFSGTANTIKAFCYDFDTLTETVNFTQKFEEAFKGSGTGASSGYRVIPSMDLVIMYVDINRSESGTSYCNECGFYAHLSTLGTDQFKYWYKDINASSSNRINHLFVTTTQGTILQAQLKGSYGSTSDSTFVEYNPSDMSVINTCTATSIGIISEDTAGGIACVYKSADNYVYIKSSGKNYKLNLKTGAYELYEGDLPLYSDNYMINPFNYSVKDNIRTYKIFGNKDLNVTFTFSIYDEGKFYSYYGDLSACYVSHDDNRVTLKNSNGIIYGIPYTLGNIEDYDYLLIPVASVGKTILPVYISGPKFN